jgi:hypothetical protein
MVDAPAQTEIASPTTAPITGSKFPGNPDSLVKTWKMRTLFTTTRPVHPTQTIKSGGHGCCWKFA